MYKLSTLVLPMHTHFWLNLLYIGVLKLTLTLEQANKAHLRSFEKHRLKHI